MMKFLIILALFYSGMASAKILIISDIDDTIKTTQMLSPARALANLFKNRNTFRNMNDLYTLVSELNEEAIFAYVSNAPKGMMAEQHEQFLRTNLFPQSENLFARPWGDVWGRGDESQEFKLKTIVKLIDDNRPTFIFLVGDNGQKDIAIYNEVVQRFPELKIKTYIHTLYSSRAGKELVGNQVPYVTSLDLAIGLYNDKLLNFDSLANFFERYAVEILSDYDIEDDGPKAFPKWMNCSLFSWPYILGSNVQNLANYLKKRLEQECRR